MKVDTKKLLIVGIVTVGVIGSGIAGFMLTRNKLDVNQNQDSDSSNPIIKEEEDEKEPDKDLNRDPDQEDNKPNEDEDSSDGMLDNTQNSSGSSNSQKPILNGNGNTNPPVKPENPSNPVVPSEPVKPVLPVIPDEEPSQPDEKPNPDEEEKPNPDEEEKPDEPEKPVDPVLEDFVLTADMIQNDTYVIQNKKYKSITLSSDIPDGVKIIFDQVQIDGNLILEESGSYQLDVKGSKMKSVTTVATPKFFSMRAMNFGTKNKALAGPTVNFDENSSMESIVLNQNIEINGKNLVSNISIQGGEEIVLNIPAQAVSINTDSTVAINQKVNHVTNKGTGATVVINAPIARLSNQASSMIYINRQNTITTLDNSANDTVVSGSGTVTNVVINASNTRIYTNVTNQPVLGDDADQVLIRQESSNRIVSASSSAQGSVTFTLAQAVPDLTLNDLSVICNAGKTISLYRLTTKDNKTFTLSTSYFKNDSYALYITLPNGNIVSKDFETDYANPTVQNVVLERISDTKASMELYGVDEGGTLYYVIEDSLTKEVINASSIQQNGKTSTVKVGYNQIMIDGLKVGRSYQLYYVIEGFFDNLSRVKGPFEISSKVKESDTSGYQIVYAKEEVSNRFVFQLNRVPERELTLEDFIIKCPTEKNLTTVGAKFMVSPDLLTYILVVPDNYGHKDNKYTVDIKVSETETIHGSFVSHFDPPVITGAVDNVIRVDENTANFTFYSDEAGTVYYGIYDWNGGIYDYNSSTPFANDVITGAISSNKQTLNAGSNTIMLDLTGKTVTKNTRVWALFIDEVGNYRVGFVDHYKIPEYVPVETPDPDSSLKITNFKATNKSITIDFNEEIGWVSSEDIVLSVLEGGSLPSKLLFSIDNDTSKHLKIDILNYTLPSGIYELKLNVYDSNENMITLVERINIS